jgi:hypothetical protein
MDGLPNPTQAKPAWVGHPGVGHPRWYGARRLCGTRALVGYPQAFVGEY